MIGGVRALEWWRNSFRTQCGVLGAHWFHWDDVGERMYVSACWVVPNEERQILW